MVGFFRRMLGLGEETRVGAAPTPPWAWACTMVATGCVVLNVLVMGLATKPSAKTTPGSRKERRKKTVNKNLVINLQLIVDRTSPMWLDSGVTGFGFSLPLLLLGDHGRRLDSLRRR